MALGSWRFSYVLVILLFGAPVFGQQTTSALASDSTQETTPSPAASAESKDPVLLHRPPPKPAIHTITMPEGRIHLDLAVTDPDGRPVKGLQPWDFSLFDNGQPKKILSFRSFDGVSVKPDPPVEIILLIDELNLPPQQIAFIRDEVSDFLRKNGGRLEQPVSIMLLTEAGVQVQPRPSIDGYALVSVVAGIKAHISSINPAMGGEGYLERFQRSLRQLEFIADNEARKPGRKLLIWVGPGWPMLVRGNSQATDKDQRRNFDGIVRLSTILREAHIVVNSVAATDTTASSGMARFMYKDFLKGVQSPRDAYAGNLALKVLATQTGGLILGPDNDVARQIEQCIANAGVFYQISFNPAPAEHADEYHDLKVKVNGTGLTVRTNTGYYNQPAGH